MNNPLVCYYADEWLDADLELAFHSVDECNGSSSSSSKSKSRAPLAKRFLRRLSNACYRLREAIRTSIERSTVYVLECEDGKYYVGSTTNRKRRYREHLRRKGSKWTRAYKPLRVLREYRRIPNRYLLGMESKVTAEAMLEFGVNNVRGSMFCSPREYHTGDIDALTKFLGHYNDLNYRKVNARLSQTLPSQPRPARKRSSYGGGGSNSTYNSGRCYTCGEPGHIAAACPERHAMSLTPNRYGLMP